jgi:hypothetical protein
MMSCRHEGLLPRMRRGCTDVPCCGGTRIWRLSAQHTFLHSCCRTSRLYEAARTARPPQCTREQCKGIFRLNGIVSTAGKVGHALTNTHLGRYPQA